MIQVSQEVLEIFFPFLFSSGEYAIFWERALNEHLRRGFFLIPITPVWLTFWKSRTENRYAYFLFCLFLIDVLKHGLVNKRTPHHHHQQQQHTLPPPQPITLTHQLHQYYPIPNNSSLPTFLPPPVTPLISTQLI